VSAHAPLDRLRLVLDARRLRLLAEVAAHGSLAAGASALGYTASAVSQQIAVLEREAGTALLERRPRGVVLTEAGEVLVRHATAVVAELQAAERALADLAGLRQGHLRLASFATAGATVLPRAVDRFRAQHPGVAFSVAQASPAQSVDRLQAGALDLALTVNLLAQPATGVAVTHLFDDPFTLALPASHPRVEKPELRLADLADETWISVPSSTSGGDALQRACARAGFVPRVVGESDDYAAIAALVGAGAGLALVPGLAPLQPGDRVVLRGLGPDGPHRAIQAATRAPAFRSAAATAMLEVLLELGPYRRPGGPQTVAAAPPSR
jgi:molybdate transport repressor ModE-like protein